MVVSVVPVVVSVVPVVVSVSGVVSGVVSGTNTSGSYPIIVLVESPTQ